MLVLLVIVLVSATFVAHGHIPLDLAKSEVAKRVQNSDMVAISISKNGELFYKKDKISIKELERRVSILDFKTPISISCDKDVKFELFIEVVNIIKKYKLESLHIVTKKV